MSARLAGVTLLAVLVTGCAGQQMRVRAYADRGLREATFAVTTVGAVRPLVETLPLAPAVKDDIGCNVVRIVGRSASVPAADLAIAERVCGGAIPLAEEAPLGLAAAELATVGTCASATVIVTRVRALIEPFLVKLETSSDASMRYAALALRAGLTLTMGGGATCS